MSNPNRARLIEGVASPKFRLVPGKPDHLTGLPSMDSWQGRARGAEMRARRTGKPVCVALLAIQHFGSFQTIHGKDAADELLMATADAWRSALRTDDLMVRLGSEFALLLPDCDIRQAQAVIDRVKDKVSTRQAAIVGVAEWDGSEPLSGTLRRASVELQSALGWAPTGG